MRIILYTGKGGVGKSSIAAATAVRVAEQGHQTLLVSSDLAHNLCDILEIEVGREPVLVSDTLAALEIDVLHEIRENWQGAQDFLTGILAYLGGVWIGVCPIVWIDFSLLRLIERGIVGPRHFVYCRSGTLRI